MSQIKYLAQAFLLLVALAAVAVAVQKLSSVELVAQKPTVIDYVEKPEPRTVVANAPGKKLFSANCAACHALDKVLTGPALRGVNERGPWTERKNAIAWVKNPAATVRKFSYAKELVNQFGGQMMPSFSNLTDAEIEAILDYLKEAQPGYASNVIVVN